MEMLWPGYTLSALSTKDRQHSETNLVSKRTKSATACYQLNERISSTGIGEALSLVRSTYNRHSPHRYAPVLASVKSLLTSLHHASSTPSASLISTKGAVSSGRRTASAVSMSVAARMSSQRSASPGKSKENSICWLQARFPKISALILYLLWSIY